MRINLVVVFVCSALAAAALSSLPLTQPLRAAEHTQQATSAADEQFQAGVRFYENNQYREAIAAWEAALSLYRTEGDRQKELLVLRNIGLAYYFLNEEQPALTYFSEALALAEELGQTDAIAQLQVNIGDSQFFLDAYPEAIAAYTAAIATNLIDHPLQLALVHNRLGFSYGELEDFAQGEAAYREGVARSQQASEPRLEANAWFGLGFATNARSDFSAAADAYQNALRLYEQLEDTHYTYLSLINLGNVQIQTESYATAAATLEQAGSLASSAAGDRHLEAVRLSILSQAYSGLSQYDQALQTAQQSLAIHAEQGDIEGQLATLTSIGNLYRILGQPQRSIEVHQQVIDLAESVGDRPTLGTAFANQGYAYNTLGQFEKALQLHQASLAIAQEIQDLALEANAWVNIGFDHFHLGAYPEAIAAYEAAQTLYRTLGNRAREAFIFDYLGEVYQAQGDLDRAEQSYYQALTIAQEVNNRERLGRVWNNLAALFAQRQQPELAIAFYKQSVNVRESIRSDLSGLEADLQQSYLDSVADAYRALADLLLLQDRVLEAQQVLDLLKVQEVDDFLQDVRGNAQTAQGVELLPAEVGIFEEFNGLQAGAVAIAQEIQSLESQATLSSAQQQRLEALQQAQRDLIRDFNSFVRSPEIRAYRDQLSYDAREQSISLQSLRGLSDNLQALDQNAVLLYPLILEDRLELILTTPGAPPTRRTVNISRPELNQLILNARNTLRDKRPTQAAAVRTAAQQLYEVLIRPLEADLQAAGAETIIYAPDGALRYIPLAALYDGDSWLVEQYQINNITALSLTDLQARPSGEFDILAAAFSEGFYEVKTAQRADSYGGLENAGLEVERLAERFASSTTALFNEAFSPDAVVPQLDRYTIIHLATHAKFVTGQPEASYILFGNGEPVTLRDIRDEWYLPNVDLVVLSACETGLGGTLGNGDEILGLGYVMQEVGAQAAIASLWQVNDAATQTLMTTFYAGLEAGLSKAAALRQAQLQLIQSADNPNHALPYYWAPFILIGNGL